MCTDAARDAPPGAARDGPSQAVADDAPGVALELNHRDAIEPHVGRIRAALGCEALAEYSFANLYLFRAAHAYRFVGGRWPCISGRTYDGARHLLPLFDLREAPLPVLVELLRAHDCFFPLPAAALPGLDPDRFAWAALPDDADYLYPAENFRHYRGERLRKKRNLMSQLLAACQVRTHRLERALMPDALRVLERWMRDKRKAAGEADELPCVEALDRLEQFGFDGEIHYVDDTPVGFVIAEPFAEGVAVMRFAKGVDSHKGIYQYMFHRYCATRAGLHWLNFEQDLGLANFRRTKRSYQPDRLLAKYRVGLREPPAT